MSMSLPFELNPSDFGRLLPCCVFDLFPPTGVEVIVNNRMTRYLVKHQVRGFINYFKNFPIEITLGGVEIACSF